MIPKILFAWALIGFCVATHAAGIAAALRWLRGHETSVRLFWPSTWLYVRVAGWVILLHLAEIFAWASWYFWGGAMADLHSSFYFSAVTYTTTGYGDLLLPPEWRFVGGVEALTGVLMCGWSTGFFFAVVSRNYAAARESKAAP